MCACAALPQHPDQHPALLEATFTVLLELLQQPAPRSILDAALRIGKQAEPIELHRFLASHACNPRGGYRTHNCCRSDPRPIVVMSAMSAASLVAVEHHSGSQHLRYHQQETGLLEAEYARLVRMRHAGAACETRRRLKIILLAVAPSTTATMLSPQKLFEDH